MYGMYRVRPLVTFDGYRGLLVCMYVCMYTTLYDPRRTVL